MFQNYRNIEAVYPELHFKISYTKCPVWIIFLRINHIIRLLGFGYR